MPIVNCSHNREIEWVHRPVSSIDHGESYQTYRLLLFFKIGIEFIFNVKGTSLGNITINTDGCLNLADLR